MAHLASGFRRLPEGQDAVASGGRPLLTYIATSKKTPTTDIYHCEGELRELLTVKFCEINPRGSSLPPAMVFSSQAQHTWCSSSRIPLFSITITNPSTAPPTPPPPQPTGSLTKHHHKTDARGRHRRLVSHMGDLFPQSCTKGSMRARRKLLHVQPRPPCRNMPGHFCARTQLTKFRDCFRIGGRDETSRRYP